MAERTIVVAAQEQGYDEFSRRDCKRMVGNTFPVTDSAGKTIGEGIIKTVKRLDPWGLQVELTVVVPEHTVTGKNLETNAGRVVRPPFGR